MQAIEVVVAGKQELLAAQAFYEARGYGGSAIEPEDSVVLAKLRGQIVGIGRLCQEQDLLWLRGMQIEPKFQRAGLGTRILKVLGQEIGGRWCCCLPYSHLVSFYRQIGFEHAAESVPPALADRLESYLSRGLKVVSMIRPARSRPNNSFKPNPLRGSA